MACKMLMLNLHAATQLNLCYRQQASMYHESTNLQTSLNWNDRKPCWMKVRLT